MKIFTKSIFLVSKKQSKTNKIRVPCAVFTAQDNFICDWIFQRYFWNSSQRDFIGRSTLRNFLRKRSYCKGSRQKVKLFALNANCGCITKSHAVKKAKINIEEFAIWYGMMSDVFSREGEANNLFSICISVIQMLIGDVKN